MIRQEQDSLHQSDSNYIQIISNMLNKAEQGKASGRCRYFNWLEQKAYNNFIILYRYCITITNEETKNILLYL